MKKLLSGVMMLLAVSVAFTNCKKSDDNSDNSDPHNPVTPSEITDFSLSKADLVMKVGDIEKVAATTGTTATAVFVWTSEDENVATVTTTTNGAATLSRADVTAVGDGQTVIYCTVNGGTENEIKKSINVTVTSELGVLVFNQATVSYSWDSNTEMPAEVLNDSTVYEIATANGTGDVVRGYMIPGTLNLFSKDLFLNETTGEIDGATEGYIMSIPCQLPYAPYELNKDVKYLDENNNPQPIFNEGELIIWRDGIYQTTDDKEKFLRLEAGVVKDEAAYLTHIKAAMTAWSTYYASQGKDESSAKTYGAELRAADEEGLAGGGLFFYEYGDGGYSTSWIPTALATDVTVNVERNDNSNFMFTINGIRATVRPFGGTNFNELYGWEGNLYYGVDLATDEITGELTVTSNNVVYQKDINYFVAKNGAPARVMGKNNMRILTADDMKAMQTKINPANVFKAVVRK